MTTKIISEHGYYEALLGLSLSKGKWDITTEEGFKKMEAVAERLAPKNGGHNKFLESMVVWLDITAPRYFWQEFDTYRVGMTKQSASTMYTITKNMVKKEDFQDPSAVPDSVIATLNELITSKDFFTIKKLLPESYLQRRIVCTNYMVLRNIVNQRKNHRLPEWQEFIEELHNLFKPRFIID